MVEGELGDEDLEQVVSTPVGAIAEPLSVGGEEGAAVVAGNGCCRDVPAGGQITLGAERANGAIQLRVVDNGEGIAPEHLPHVFDRFYRADQARSTDSSGLGLAIARSIINLHQGHIQMESEPGRGTAFLIQLPTYQG